jgi:hypothetical protein
MDSKSDSPPVVKPKKVLSEAQLSSLKKARELAAQKRIELGNITKKEKELKNELYNERLKNVKDVEKTVLEKPAPPPPLKAKKKKKKKVVESSSSSDDDSQSENGSESSVSSIEKKPKRKTSSTPAQRVKKMSVNKLASEVTKDELKNRILQSSYREAFSSIFPNHHNVFA